MNKEIIKLVLLTYCRPSSTMMRLGMVAGEGAAYHGGMSESIDKGELEPTIASYDPLSQAQENAYDPERTLSALKSRDEGWRSFLAEDEMMDGRPVTSFSLSQGGRYVGTVKYISRTLHSGYLASSFGEGILNEEDVSGKYRPLPLHEAAQLVEERAKPKNLTEN